MRRLMAASALAAVAVVGCGGGDGGGEGSGDLRSCAEIEAEMEALAAEIQEAVINGDAPPDSSRQEDLAKEIAKGCKPPG